MFRYIFLGITYYNPLLPHTTSERENVKTTIKEAQVIPTISIWIMFSKKK
jgi:hypothetical protein